jgi:hypothetical protein
MKKFDLNKIGENIAKNLIKRAKKSEQARMSTELKQYQSEGYEVEHYELNDTKKILLRSPKGRLVAVSE